MSIIGIGVDLCSMTRLEGVLRRRGVQKFAKRILSHEEYLDFEKQTESASPCRAVEFLSGRYVMILDEQIFNSKICSQGSRVQVNLTYSKTRMEGFNYC